MSGILSVNALAAIHADDFWNQVSSKTKVKKDVFLQRASWDFAVTFFNLTTLLTIVSVAVAVFSSSPFFALIAFLAFQARGSFMDYLEKVQSPHHIEQDSSVVLQSLEQSNKNWQPIAAQFLDFRIWMNWTLKL